MIRELNYRVIGSDGDIEGAVHIENVSLTLARVIATMLNDMHDHTYFTIEEMEDEDKLR